jgi:Uma2 family endonuclease
MPLSQKREHYTYADYATWPDDVRYELIGGEAWLMSPAPAQRHQEICIEIVRQLADYLDDKPCRVFIAPFDVRLNAEADDDTVVQPDILVVCDKAKLNGKNCVGAPDMIVEVLSPSTTKHDRITKLALYRRYGVREYWTVDPDVPLVETHILKDGDYIIRRYGDSGEVAVIVLDGCVINLDKVFRFRHEEAEGSAAA